MDRPDSFNDPEVADSSIFETTPPGSRADSNSTDREARPGSLTTICILTIVLGVLGLLTGFTGLMSQLFASNLQDAMAALPQGNNPSGMEVQKEMNAKVLAVSRQYTWFTAPLMVVKIGIEAVLLAGAVWSWGLKPRGRSWLLFGFAAAIVSESLLVVPGIMVQRETMAVMSEYMPKMMASQPSAQNHPAGMGTAMSAMSSAIGIVSLVFAVGWITVKIVFYAVTIRYLRKPIIVSLFEPMPS